MSTVILSQIHLFEISTEGATRTTAANVIVIHIERYSNETWEQYLDHQNLINAVYSALEKLKLPSNWSSDMDDTAIIKISNSNRDTLSALANELIGLEYASNYDDAMNRLIKPSPSKTSTRTPASTTTKTPTPSNTKLSTTQTTSISGTTTQHSSNSGSISATSTINPSDSETAPPSTSPSNKETPTSSLSPTPSLNPSDSGTAPPSASLSNSKTIAPSNSISSSSKATITPKPTAPSTTSKTVQPSKSSSRKASNTPKPTISLSNSRSILSSANITSTLTQNPSNSKTAPLSASASKEASPTSNPITSTLTISASETITLNPSFSNRISATFFSANATPTICLLQPGMCNDTNSQITSDPATPPPSNQFSLELIIALSALAGVFLILTAFLIRHTSRRNSRPQTTNRQRVESNISSTGEASNPQEQTISNETIPSSENALSFQSIEVKLPEEAQQEATTPI